MQCSDVTHNACVLQRVRNTPAAMQQQCPPPRPHTQAGRQATLISSWPLDLIQECSTDYYSRNLTRTGRTSCIGYKTKRTTLSEHRTQTDGTWLRRMGCWEMRWFSVGQLAVASRLPGLVETDLLSLRSRRIERTGLRTDERVREEHRSYT